MTGPQFFQTFMGRKFYEADVPAVVQAIRENTAAINRVAAALEKLAATQPDPQVPTTKEPA